MNDMHKKTEARFQGEWRWLLMTLIALSVISCSSPPPDTRVDSVQVTLQMASDVNPNVHGKASPVRVTLYKLALSDEFLASDYLSLSEGKDVELNAQVHKSYDVIMVPGEKRNNAIS
ncbi:type VI secretion system lipoprotein TssJ [Serratia sp. L9]|uniref:type VI secretion system lipoprotein TssJ n=1 Tax=Serratia sp. L9 TaxID=3423946 RepID=UPI003D668DA3